MGNGSVADFLGSKKLRNLHGVKGQSPIFSAGLKRFQKNHSFLVCRALNLLENSYVAIVMTAAKDNVLTSRVLKGPFQ